MLQGEKIGHTMEKIERLTHDQTDYVRTTTVEQMQIQRAGQPLKMAIENVFLSLPDGSLKQFSTKVDQAGSVTRFTGQVARDGKTLSISTQGGSSQGVANDSIPWQPGYGGLHAVYRLFQEPPIEAGQKRSAMALVPTMNRMAKHSIQGQEKEAVSMLDGSMVTLLKTKYLTEIEGQPPLESTAWVDEVGEIVKMTSPVQNFEIYRCSKEFALSPNKAVSFDLALDTIVPVDRMPQRNRDELEELTYEVKLKSGDPAKIFASSSNQKVTAIDANTAKLRVWRIRPDTKLPAELPENDKPTDADLASSPLVQVEDPAVQELLRKAKFSGANATQQVMLLEKFVHDTIEEKNFSQGFLSAAEVAQGKTGDCTEHAVLLMALLRAKGFPARGALGLVYVDYGEKKGFAYHMWTEVWMGDRWLPLDATRGKGGIGVDYIKVTQTDLSGSGAFAAFLPVTQVIGQLEIEVAE
ncbi:transglutaminase-like domain-containing protein [Bremerella volcania]|uniref:transglutaminase-like domain-containing protein n=1 Tax=Bremerella volcania TaxID=2527984 RepID=UPI0013FD0109|nr:transglutaminase family protein [Bremerella volcania]